MFGSVVGRLSSPFCRMGDVKKLKFTRCRILRSRLHLSPPQCILHLYEEKSGDMAYARDFRLPLRLSGMAG